MSNTLDDLHKQWKELPEIEWQRMLRETLGDIAIALGYINTVNSVKPIERGIPKGYDNLYAFLIEHKISHTDSIILINWCIKAGFNEWIIIEALTPQKELKIIEPKPSLIRYRLKS
jgi:hypothetical protein